MENKEIIKKLTRYFLKDCDPKVVAKLLAACLVDINRIRHFEHLPDSEKENLMLRINHNSDELLDFVKNGAKQALVVENLSFGEKE